MPMEHITVNLDGKLVRREQMDGRPFLVAPLVMMTEGVHEGSDGPILYRKAELTKWCPSWNHKPITNGHPEDNGTPLSGSDPQVLNQFKLGVVLNTKYDNKQRAEAWFDEDLLRTRCPAVLKALNKKKMMEVSTGLVVDLVGGKGKWGDKEYIGEAKNHRPDHLAILVDKIGACSIADGAGLLQLNEADLKVVLNREESLEHGLLRIVMHQEGIREAINNELSHSAIHSALRAELNESPDRPSDVWIEDVYRNYFVFWKDGELRKQKYKANNSGVELEGDPELVERVVSFRPINEANPVTEENTMAKKELVDGLISNKATKWEEKNRDFLMTLSEEQLGLMEPVANANPNPNPSPTPSPSPNPGPGTPAPSPNPSPSPTPTPAPGPTPTSGQATPANQKSTVEEYIANAPPQIAHILANSVAVFNQEKERHIEVILANPNNVLKKEQLDAMDINTLFALSKMAQNQQAATTKPQAPTPSYLGLAPTHNSGGGAIKETPMGVPTLNFAPKAKAS